MIMEITLVFVLTLSLAANIFMLWYIRNLLSNMLELTDNIAGFKEEVSIYKKHLQSIYELEMFYGDETLGGLLEHGKSLLESMDMFDEFVDLLGEDEIEEEDIQIQEDYDDGDSEANAETFAQGKTVFHGSP
jgi:hypothetical protein|tara:strand:- start:185 stop:580 length:396 start_codon:yes stop_codon:yes gene_type:complete